MLHFKFQLENVIIKKFIRVSARKGGEYLRVSNAIIMAAGTSSRFAPLSYEKHKALTVVKGEILINRQIEQLIDGGVPEIYVVTGYKAEQFDYLVSKYGVKLIYNPDYLTRNNNGSIWAARKVIGNSYICSADNYFSINPFELEVNESYYAAEYAEADTAEWCIGEDARGYISSVEIGGSRSWYMLGHTFWSSAFSAEFLRILEMEYNLPETAHKLWEKIFMGHLDTLKMKIRKYDTGVIYEFDTLNELRKFDTSYVFDTRSIILKKIAAELGVEERLIVNIQSMKSATAEAAGFEFDCVSNHFIYLYETGRIEHRPY